MGDDFIPDGSFQPDAVAEPAGSAPHIQNSGPDFVPDNSFVSDEDKYGTTGQMALTALEGAGRGIAGPLAPLAETKILGIKPEDIRGRAETNPYTHGIAEAGAMAGTMIAGTGEAALAAKLGEGAAAAVGLAEPVGYAAKVGSSIVRNAAEMAVFQAGDEASKAILQDPEFSAESAITNVGLAAAIGGAAGGFITGAVNPLWDATVGHKMERFLGGLKTHLDGGGLNMPETVDQALKTLGTEVSPEMRAALSGNPKAAQLFNELRESQHPGTIAQLKQLEKDANEGVMRAFRHTPEDIANYSEAEGGKAALTSFKDEFKAKYEPIAKEFEEVTSKFKTAEVYPSQQAALADRVVQLAQEKGYMAEGFQQAKLMNAVLDRIPAVKTAEDLAKLNSIVSNLSHSDLTLRRAGRELQDIIMDTQHNAMAYAIGKDAPELMGRYTAARGAYKDFANIAQEMSDNLKLGKFSGYKTFLERLETKRTPEQFIKRLSPKGNAEIIDYLGKHFPQTLESVRDTELKRLLKPAVLSAKGDNVINNKVLMNAIARGQPEHIGFAIPKQALEHIRAADTIMEAIPGMKSSGTAGWMQKLTRYVPQSAMAALAFILHGNPVTAFLTAHAGQMLGNDAPNAIKLGMLKFLGSDQPIKSAGFKSMVSFMDQSIKGQSMLMQSAKAVFESGKNVLIERQVPNAKDREKLDKAVSDLETHPDGMMRLAQGNVGHYMPDHQTALTQTAVQTLDYLKKLKPQPFKASPLDKEVKPGAAETARYNRALDIANSPALVLKHVKDGTIQANDLIDLKSMYPALYRQFANQLTNEMTSAQAAGKAIPYTTKMGLSLFLGQAIDSTMKPMAIIAAQPMPVGGPTPGQGPAPKSGNTSKLGKMNKDYMTPLQSSESHKLKH